MNEFAQLVSTGITWYFVLYVLTSPAAHAQLDCDYVTPVISLTDSWLYSGSIDQDLNDYIKRADYPKFIHSGIGELNVAGHLAGTQVRLTLQITEDTYRGIQAAVRAGAILVIQQQSYEELVEELFAAARVDLIRERIARRLRGGGNRSVRGPNATFVTLELESDAPFTSYKAMGGGTTEERLVGLTYCVLYLQTLRRAPLSGSLDFELPVEDELGFGLRSGQVFVGRIAAPSRALDAVITLERSPASALLFR